MVTYYFRISWHNDIGHDIGLATTFILIERHWSSYSRHGEAKWLAEMGFDELKVRNQ